MKKIVLILLMVFISGCGNSVYPQLVDRAQELCEANEGVKRIYVSTFGNEVKCNNGAVFFSSTVDKRNE